MAADEILEARLGRTTGAIFAEEGAERFRPKETAVLSDLCRLQDHVIATGGGVIMQPGNCAQMRQAGLVIWLSADAPTLWQRLQADASTAQRRPALTCGGLAGHEELFAGRQPPHGA